VGAERQRRRPAARQIIDGVIPGESPEVHPFPPMSDRWAAILRGEHPLRFAQRAGRRAFAIAPGSTRCKLCNAPFTGPSAVAFRLCGYGQSRKNPQLCARCVESAPEGGAIVPLSILFADMRGYTSLTERLGSIQATALVNRFYEVASKSFLPYEGLLGQIAGDEVMVLFVPGLAGSTYRAKAVEAGLALLDAVGYGKSTSSWVEVGVGIASGEEFVGNVGGGGFKDFTAIGDVTNTAARLTSVAQAGEIVLDTTTREAVAADYPAAERELLSLKGKGAAVEAFRLRLG
jgi:adenylate cyclase